MSDEQAPAQEAPEADQAPDTNTPNEDGKTFSAEDVNRIVAERLERDRRNRDLSPEEVKALKDQATEAQRKADESKTSEQKLAERIAQLEAETAATKREALVNSVRADFKISAEDAELFLTADDPDQLRTQAARLADLTKPAQAEVPKTTRTASKDGANPRPAPDEERSFVRGLVNKSL